MQVGTGGNLADCATYRALASNLNRIPRRAVDAECVEIGKEALSQNHSNYSGR